MKNKFIIIIMFLTLTSCSRDITPALPYTDASIEFDVDQQELVNAVTVLCEQAIHCNTLLGYPPSDIFSFKDVSTCGKYYNDKISNMDIDIQRDFIEVIDYCTEMIYKDYNSNPCLFLDCYDCELNGVNCPWEAN